MRPITLFENGASEPGEILKSAMICRQCLQRSSALSARTLTPRAPSTTATTPASWNILLPVRSSSSRRPIPSTATRHYASAAAAPAADSIPPLSTPLGDGQGGDSSGAGATGGQSLSSCPEGTLLTGLNYFKNKTDPVARADSAYPEWLWRCLDVQKKKEEGETDDAGDEFCKSLPPLYPKPLSPKTISRN